MRFDILVFEYLKVKLMYIIDLNYYFKLKTDNKIKVGVHFLDFIDIVRIAKENDPVEFDSFMKVDISKRLSLMNSLSVDEHKKQLKYGQFTICLHPSRACNLSCKYCFKDSEYLNSNELTTEMAIKCINYFIDEYAPFANRYVIDLSGSGEPLLNIDLIKDIVLYCKNKQNKVGKIIDIMMCTNLTLLTNEMVDYLESEHSIILGVSIDGDKVTNDNNRVYITGKGTYDNIIKNLKMFKTKKLGVAVTITPQNQNVDKIYNSIYNLQNVDCVSMNMIRNFDASEYDIKKFNLECLIKSYERLSGKIYDQLSNNNFDYLEKIIKGADLFGNYLKDVLFKNYTGYYACDAGKNRISVDSSGNIYSCSVMVGHSAFYLGDINEGIQSELINKYYIPQSNNKYCNDCHIKHICGGECYINSYLKNGDLLKPVENICVIKNELVKIAMCLVKKIQLYQNHIYNKLIQFVIDTQYYYQTDSSLWVANCFLVDKNVKINFSDIVENIQLDSYGCKIESMVAFLRKYVDVDVYMLENNFLTKNINFPAICMVNKIRDTRFKYIIIEEIKNGYVYFRQINYPKIQKELYQVFITKVSNIIIV